MLVAVLASGALLLSFQKIVAGLQVGQGQAIPAALGLHGIYLDVACLAAASVLASLLASLLHEGAGCSGSFNLR